MGFGSKLRSMSKRAAGSLGASKVAKPAAGGIRGAMQKARSGGIMGGGLSGAGVRGAAAKAKRGGLGRAAKALGGASGIGKVTKASGAAKALGAGTSVVASKGKRRGLRGALGRAKAGGMMQTAVPRGRAAKVGKGLADTIGGTMKPAVPRGKGKGLADTIGAKVKPATAAQRKTPKGKSYSDKVRAGGGGIVGPRGKVKAGTKKAPARRLGLKPESGAPAGKTTTRSRIGRARGKTRRAMPTTEAATKATAKPMRAKRAMPKRGARAAKSKLTQGLKRTRTAGFRGRGRARASSKASPAKS